MAQHAEEVCLDTSCGLAEEVRQQLTLLKTVAYEERGNPLIHVPQGTSFFGTDNPIIKEDMEDPERRIFVESFYLQTYEVSNYEFAQFVADTNHETDAEYFNFSFSFHGILTYLPDDLKSEITQQVQDYPWWLPIYGSNWFYPFGNTSSTAQQNVFEAGLLNHPVIHVSYNDAKSYCKWKGFRLPSEVEFEKAAHGTNVNNSIYPWGNKLHTRDRNNSLVYRANVFQGTFPNTNSKKDGFEFTAPVDSFGPQNELGFYNLIGNVWEWVENEWYPAKKEATSEGASKEAPDTERVKKGGSFLCHKSYCFRYRIAARSHNTADTSAQNLGFRCAVTNPV